ncbi:unnamed protein product [Rhizophagus irregularis]|nr:unnamed protein product [Rhizophagus irregularis]
MYCQNFTIIESSFDLAHNENFRRLSKGSSSLSIFRPEEPSKKSSKTITCSQDSPITSGPVTPSTVETPNNSRPVTPTIPSFSQNANVINYGRGSDEQQE